MKYRVWKLATSLALYETAARFKGTIFGVFWIWLSLAVRALAIGAVYGKIFDRALDEYLPYLLLGLVIWAYFSSAFSTMTASLTRAKPFLLQYPHINPVFFCFKDFLKETGLFLLTVTPCVAVVAGLGWVQAENFLHLTVVLLGSFGLLALNVFLVGYFLSVASIYVRDLPHVFNSVMQVGFLVTPVLWEPSFIGESSAFLVFNPFYHLLELIRYPLLEGVSYAGIPLVFLTITCPITSCCVAIYWLTRRRIREFV